MRKLLFTKMLSLAVFAMPLFAAAAEPLVIPMKQDPPIMVDGNADDWADVKSEIKLGKGNFLATFHGEAKWGGEKDLSGVMRFCWKPNGLYLCAQVTDDVFLQIDSGVDCFWGDHLELFMDLKPEDAGNGNDFGEGQLQILVTPGDFGKIKPQVVQAFPKPLEVPKAQCASTKQDNGWTVEAFIPWASLNGGAIRENTAIAMHAWISDSDVNISDHPTQKQILTTGNVNAEFRKRTDLTPAVFADAEGKYTIALSGRDDVHLEFKEPIPTEKSTKLDFTMPKYPQYLSPVLRIHANLTTDSPMAGYARVMDITVNGTQLTGKHLITPRDEFFEKGGKMNTIYHAGIGYLVPYTNNGKNGNNPTFVSQFFTIPYDMHDFAIDLSGVLKEGRNTIQIRNSLPTKYASKLELSDVRICIEHLGYRRKSVEAPTGPLPVIVPKAPLDMAAVAVESSSSRISMKLPNGRSFVVTSRYSTPDGKWAEGSNDFFKHERTVERLPEGFLVKDTFTNLRDENLPIIMLHEVAEKNAEFLLGGLQFMASSNLRRIDGNTSVFVKCPDGGLGLFASSLIFREHFCAMVKEGGSVVMGDNSLALPPKGSMTHEFIAVPLEKAEYYDFVNAVRRQIGVNVTLQGPQGTLGQYKDWERKFYGRINMLGLHYMLCDLNKIGIEFLLSEHRNGVKEMMAEIKKIRPSILNYRYYHSQIEVNGDVEFKSGRLLLKNGGQALYGDVPLYLNLEGTAYTRMMEFVLDDILENWDVDGIYWDEFHYSGKEFHYGEPWDNCSADIDMETHKIDKLKSSVFLIQRPWKTRMVDKIRAKGKRIYANGCTALHGFEDKIDFTFTETQLKTNNARVHFTTPLAHENCDGMKSMQDYYLKMIDSLDYGVLGNFSFISVPHTNDVWPTIAEHMYPTTPLELHKGYVIGKERIVTKTSGRFGWNDASEHTVRVFNAVGQEVKEHGMKTVTIDGRTFTDIRLAGDWSAVIIRK